MRTDRKRLTVRVPEQLLDDLCRAAYWERQPLQDLTEHMLRAGVNELISAHGEPYPEIPTLRLRPGRVAGRAMTSPDERCVQKPE